MMNSLSRHFSTLFLLIPTWVSFQKALRWAFESVVQTEGRQLNCGAGDSYRPGLAACTEKQLWFPNCFWPTVRRSKMVRICPSNAEWSLALARISCGITGTPLMIYICIFTHAGKSWQNRPGWLRGGNVCSCGSCSPSAEASSACREGTGKRTR